MRPLGEVTGDLEDLLYEMCLDHDLQRGEVLALVKNWIDVHCPEAIEEYDEDNSNPVYLYGHKDYVKKTAEKL